MTLGETLVHVPYVIATATADSHPRFLPEDSLAVGELWLSGAALARGYLQSSTAAPSDAAFLSGIFSTDDRWYRTGDLVRRTTDGQLRYCGRLDDQVKIDGVRVDVNEICRAITCIEGFLSALANI